MRRIFPLILLSAILVFSACNRLYSGTVSDFTPKTDICAVMDVKTDDYSFSANIKADAANNILMEFTAPESLKSFAITATENGCNIDAYGIKDAVPYDYIQPGSCLNLIITSLKTALFSNCGEFRKNANGAIVTSFTADSAEATAEFNSDGYLTAISVPEKSLYAVFTY